MAHEQRLKIEKFQRLESDLQNEIKSLQTSLSDKDNLSNKLHSRLNELQMRESHLQSELSKMKFENTENISAKQQSLEKIQRLSLDMESVKRECDDLRDKLGRKTNQCNHFQAEVQTLLNQEDMCNQKLRQFELINNNYSQDILRLKSEITHSKMENEQLRKYSSKYQSEIQELNADIKSLFRDFEMKKDQISHEQRMSQQLKHEIERLNSVINTRNTSSAPSRYYNANNFESTKPIAVCYVHIHRFSCR